MEQQTPSPEDTAPGLKPGADGKPRKLAHVLEEIANDTSQERISINTLLHSMDARAFGALLLIFAIPNVLPAPPGTSGILGLPLIYLTSQMMMGRLPWLPKLIAERSIERSAFVKLVTKITPWLARAEKLTAPRLQNLLTDRTEQLIGAFCFVLALVLVLPIPLGNMLPSFAIVLIALGVLERDGLWVLGGLITGVISLVIVSSVIWAMLKAAAFVLTHIF